MAQGFLGNSQPPQMNACCALKSARNPHGMGVVALWRIESEHAPRRGKERAARARAFLWREQRNHLLSAVNWDAFRWGPHVC